MVSALRDVSHSVLDPDQSRTRAGQHEQKQNPHAQVQTRNAGALLQDLIHTSSNTLDV